MKLFFCCLAVLYRQNNAHMGNKLKIKKCLNKVFDPDLPSEQFQCVLA